MVKAASTAPPHESKITSTPSPGLMSCFSICSARLSRNSGSMISVSPGCFTAVESL